MFLGSLRSPGRHATHNKHNSSNQPHAGRFAKAELSYAAPSGYSSASFSSRDNVSTVVPVRFHAPSLSNR